jgi:hypothetical protein
MCGDRPSIRELYVIDSRDTAIKRNRRLLVRTDIIDIVRLNDVLSE